MFSIYLTRESVLRQQVQPPSGNASLSFSIGTHCGEASQCVLRLGGALVPLGQRRVRLQRGHVTDGGDEEGWRQLGRWGWEVGGVRRPESNRRVWKVGGDSTLDWTLEEEIALRLNN